MKKIFLIFIIFGMLIVPAYADNTEKNIIPLLGQLDIMKGDLDGNLRLDDLVTRAEFTKIAIASSAYKNSVAKNINVSPYKDVTHAHWAAPYIKVASSNKLVNGYVDGSFKPDETVLFEEALNVVLKLLGYTDSDFGSSWPYGQVSLAENLGLTENVDKNVGDNLTRNDVSKIIYNLFNVKPKGSISYYIEKLNYSILKDEILIATPNTDTSVGSGKILTSQGNFKTSLTFDKVGQKGNFIIKNLDEVVAFMPNEQIINEYLVYQVLDSEIIVSENGVLKPLDIANELVIYNKSQKTTLKDTLSKIAVGDTITIYKTENGVIDYGTVVTQNLEGPFTVDNTSAYSNSTIIRDGIKTDAVKMNDIVYISKALNTVWAYSKKVTGIYEKAIPNKDNPTSVTISGAAYTIESGTAFEKLSSNGNYKFGDTITVLLGRDGKIADVMSNTNEVIVGYLLETGKKTYNDSYGDDYSSYYVKIAQADGEVYEYASKLDYLELKNKIVRVTFVDQYAKISSVTPPGALSGEFNYENYKIGNVSFSPDVKIIDVSTNDLPKNGSFIKVFPQRLDGLTISKENIYYYEKNEKGEVNTLFLNDFTGDIYKYGIVTSAENRFGNMSARGTYTYDIDGTTSTLSTSETSFSIQSGQPAKFEIINNKIESITPLFELQGQVINVSNAFIEIGINKYVISDKITVYQKTSDYKFFKIPFSDIIGNKNYNILAYVDESVVDGKLGRVRVFVVTKKY
jgi:hypothetical protein